MTNAILEVAIDHHIEGHLLLGVAIAFRQPQRIAQLLVVMHRQTQGSQSLVGHGAQLVGIQIGQLAAVESLLHIVVAGQTQHPIPALLVMHQQLARQLVILTLVGQTPLNAVDIATANLKLRLGLSATRTGAHQLLFDLALVLACVLLHVRRHRHAHGLQLLLELAQRLALGIEPRLQGGLDLHRLGKP